MYSFRCRWRRKAEKIINGMKQSIEVEGAAYVRDGIASSGWHVIWCSSLLDWMPFDEHSRLEFVSMCWCRCGRRRVQSTMAHLIDRQGIVAPKCDRRIRRYSVSRYRCTSDDRKSNLGHPLDSCRRKSVARSSFLCRTSRNHSAKWKKWCDQNAISIEFRATRHLYVLLCSCGTVHVPAQREYLRIAWIVNHFVTWSRRWSFFFLRSLVNQRPTVTLNAVAPQVAEVFEAIPTAIQVHHAVGRVDDQLMAAPHSRSFLGIHRLL